MTQRGAYVLIALAVLSIVYARGQNSHASKRYSPKQGFTCNPFRTSACRCFQGGECPDGTTYVYMCGRHWSGSQCCLNFWVTKCMMMYFYPGLNPYRW